MRHKIHHYHHHRVCASIDKSQMFREPITVNLDFCIGKLTNLLFLDFFFLLSGPLCFIVPLTWEVGTINENVGYGKGGVVVYIVLLPNTSHTINRFTSYWDGERKFPEICNI